MNWGKRIILKFDREVYGVSSALKNKFRLKEEQYGTYIYPSNVTYGADHRELFLEFDDFNNVNEPVLLEYPEESELMGIDLPVQAFQAYPVLQNLNKKGLFEYIEMSVSATGELEIAFDGKSYLNEYMQLTPVCAGTLVAISFVRGYMPIEYMQLTVSTAGMFCDINGIPV